MQVTFAAARVNAGLTQGEVALKLNISQATLSSWERGITDPTIKQIRAMCALYGCDITDIRA